MGGLGRNGISLHGSALHADGHGASHGRVAHAIGDEIRKHLTQTIAVCGNFVREVHCLCTELVQHGCRQSGGRNRRAPAAAPTGSVTSANPAGRGTDGRAGSGIGSSSRGGCCTEAQTQ
jgi:hypothetical protein